MLTRETMTGPWAGLPVAWTDEDRFDEETYRGDLRTLRAWFGEHCPEERYEAGAEG